MNYIVFDLEWNQNPSGKKTRNDRLPFEIIEIGAVKLDSSFNVVGEFDRLIRPQLYTKLHHIVKELLDVSSEELLAGGALALLCNLICVLPGESGVIPLNAVTPILGAPVIIYVIINQRRIQYFN